MYFLLSVQRCLQHSSLKIMRRSAISVTNRNAISSADLLRSHLPTSSHVRTFWESFPHVRPLFYEKDGLSRNDYELIYHAKLFNYAFYAQLVSLSAFASQFVVSLYKAYNSYVAQEVIKVVTNVGPFVVNYDLSTLLIITVFTIQNALIFIAAQTACFRAYYCEETDKFVLISLAVNPFKSKVSYCNPGELVPLNPSMLNIVCGNHKIKGKRLFIRPDNFRKTYLYNRLVGNNHV